MRNAADERSGKQESRTAAGAAVPQAIRAWARIALLYLKGPAMALDVPDGRTLDPVAAVRVAGALLTVFFFPVGVFAVLAGGALVDISSFLLEGAPL